MDLKTFAKLYKKFSRFPLEKEKTARAEYKVYLNALLEDKHCEEWFMQKKATEAGMDTKEYCCSSMAYYLIEDKKRNTYSGLSADSVITHRKKSKVYGLPVQDGGSSFIQINYCPWCGEGLSSDI